MLVINFKTKGNTGSDKRLFRRIMYSIFTEYSYKRNYNIGFGINNFTDKRFILHEELRLSDPGLIPAEPREFLH